MRPLVAAQRSWLALESSSTEPPAAMDHPWQLLRRLAAALCDEQVLAVGFREPEAYETVFVLRDAETATVLQSPKPLSIALIRQPSSSLPFAPRRAEEQSPELKKQLRQLARQWRGGSSRPATEIRVAIDRGHRREHAWFRVASVEHAQYTGEQFLADLIPTDATADFLSEGRYQIYSNAIQEIRLGK
jgi:hypothetical protein